MAVDLVAPLGEHLHVQRGGKRLGEPRRLVTPFHRVIPEGLRGVDDGEQQIRNRGWHRTTDRCRHEVVADDSAPE